MPDSTSPQAHVVLFQHSHVRRVLHGDAWWFVIVDVVAALTDSANPARYLKDMRRRDALLGEALKGGGNLPPPLRCPSTLRADHRNFSAGTRRAFFVSSSPFRRPRRSRSSAGSPQWKKRGVKEHREYGILTAEISKATFGMTPTEYRTHKALTTPTDNLRDHMTDLELIFTMLGEASTTEIARNTDAQGFPRNKKAAQEGGKIAGNARRELETKSGRRVSTKVNFKEVPEIQRRLRAKSKDAAP